MKYLDGREVQGYIKNRQLHDVKALRSRKIFPKLVIFYDNDSPVIAKYMSLKQRYGEDIGITTEVIKLPASQTAAEEILATKAQDSSVQGIIIQLPLENLDQKILEKIPPEKDVDGLNNGMESATADAINWLLGAYNVDLSTKKIALVGKGKLVGGPLFRMWTNSGFDVTAFVRGDDLSVLNQYDVIVTATSQVGLIKPEMLKEGAVVVDAGTTSDQSVLKGDVDPAVYERADITITPQVGGVGPLTIALLFEHLLQLSK